MNEKPSPSIDVPDIMSVDNNMKYNEKKKLSLTLPLLNVVSTETGNEKEDSNETVTQKENSTEPTSASSKIKKIYESDDVSIQTIFSQTIKSTTTTPTDEEHSPDFEMFVKKTVVTKTTTTTTNAKKHLKKSNSQQNSCNEVLNVSEYALSSIDEPVEAFTYFHQTIEEDEPPSDLHESITSYNPENILTANHNSNNNNNNNNHKETNDSIECHNIDSCTRIQANENISQNAEPDISLTNTSQDPDVDNDVDDDDSNESELNSNTLSVSISAFIRSF